MPINWAIINIPYMGKFWGANIGNYDQNHSIGDKSNYCEEVSKNWRMAFYPSNLPIFSFPTTKFSHVTIVIIISL